MKTKKLQNSVNRAAQRRFKKIPRRLSNDKQKARLLLGSNRLLDDDIYIKQFHSWEQPEQIYNSK